MLLLFAALSLLLAAGYLWTDRHVRRDAAVQAALPRPTYVCRHCGRRVELGTTLRPIRLSLLCPDDYHREYGPLPPPPGPAPRRRGPAEQRRVSVPLHPLLMRRR